MKFVITNNAYAILSFGLAPKVIVTVNLRWRKMRWTPEYVIREAHCAGNYRTGESITLQTADDVLGITRMHSMQIVHWVTGWCAATTSVQVPANAPFNQEYQSAQ